MVQSSLAWPGPPRRSASLGTEINGAIRDPEFQERFRATGLVPAGGTPAELGAYLESEIARWTKVVKDAGIKAE